MSYEPMKQNETPQDENLTDADPELVKLFVKCIVDETTSWSRGFAQVFCDYAKALRNFNSACDAIGDHRD